MTDKVSANPVSVKCTATKDPAVRATIGLCIALAGAAWCAYDIFIAKNYEYKPLSEDINAFGGYIFNLAGVIILPIVALIVLVKLMKFKKRFITADENGISENGAKPIAWSEITQLDATKLKAKDIIVLHHPAGTLKLDAWKLTNFRELLELVQEKIPAEKTKIS